MATAAILKYSSLSTIDPTFVPLKDECDASFAAFWALPPAELEVAGANIPAALLDDTPRDLDITHRMVPVRDGTEIEVRIYQDKEKIEAKAKEGIKVPLFLVAHGGGWVFGGHDVEEAMNRLVAKEAAVVVVSVNYRLYLRAPKFRFPYAANDCFDVFKWCKQNAATLKIDPSLIIVAGSSAGGNLTAVVAQMARDENEGGIVGQVLNIPVTCHPNHFPTGKYEYNSWTQNSNASILGKDTMSWCWNQYLPGGTSEVYASPLLAKSLKGLPPALVQIAGMDPLRDEGLAYAERLKEAGVPVTTTTYPGLPHGFYMYPQLPASSKFSWKVAEWVKELLATKSYKADL